MSERAKAFQVYLNALLRDGVCRNARTKTEGSLLLCKAFAEDVARMATKEPLDGVADLVERAASWLRNPTRRS